MTSNKSKKGGKKRGFVRKYLLPDCYFENVYSITPKLLSSLGINAVVLDIDNTLVTYDDPKPTEPVLKWLKSLENAGIKASFVSNNDEERVSLFNKELGYFYSSNSKKPSSKQTINAMKHMGSDSSSTAAIGDQLFTDVLSAKQIGLMAFLVPPIKDKTTFLFRFKRFFERKILKRHMNEIVAHTKELTENA